MTFYNLLKTRFSLIWNVLKPLPKSVSIPPGLTTAANAATNVAIHKKYLELVIRH